MLTNLVGSILRLGRTFTPPIDAPNGIAEMKRVDLNGYPQWILIRGHDVSGPLFLSLHGGPGESNLWLQHHTMDQLERHLICVNWDQRGTGKSLRPRPDPKTMTIAQFLEDTIALIELLRARFNKEKILLLGHSWGTVLAMKVAAKRPDLLHAVIGMNQIVDNARGEEISYQYTLERARAENNRKAIRILEHVGGSDTYTKEARFVERRWLSRYGGLVHRTSMREMVSIMLEAREYSIADCIGYLQMEGMKFSISCMAEELNKLNLGEEIKELSVPAFFFLGRHDYTTPFVLAEEFFGSLRAPYKKLIWFEQSAHTPDLDEPEKFQHEVLAVAKEFAMAAPTIRRGSA